MPHRLLATWMPEIFSASAGTTIAVYAQVFDPSTGIPTTIGIGTVCGILLWSFIRRTDADQKTITTLIGEKQAMFSTAIETQKVYTATMVDSQEKHTAAIVKLTERIMAGEAEQHRCMESMVNEQRETRALLEKLLADRRGTEQ